MIKIKKIRRSDYKTAQKFAIQGMHLDWYMDSKAVRLCTQNIFGIWN